MNAQTIEIFKELQGTNSKNEKQEILKRNKNNEELKYLKSIPMVISLCCSFHHIYELFYGDI